MTQPLDHVRQQHVKPSPLEAAAGRDESVGGDAAAAVFVVARDGHVRSRLRKACQTLGRSCTAVGLADVIVWPARVHPARLAVVAASGLDVPLGAVLDSLRTAGVQTVALHGPEFGSLVHLLALELGFDHVWGESANDEALAVLVKHAGIQRARRPVTGHVQLDGTELSVDTASLVCTVRGIPFRLGTSATYTLKLLLDKAPHLVSREDIEATIPATRVGRTGGSRVVDAHISRLRQRLRQVGADAVRIVAIRGQGYRLTTRGSTVVTAGLDGPPGT